MREGYPWNFNGKALYLSTRRLRVWSLCMPEKPLPHFPTPIYADRNSRIVTSSALTDPTPPVGKMTVRAVAEFLPTIEPPDFNEPEGTDDIPDFDEPWGCDYR
jgi:hypothetical protein